MSDEITTDELEDLLDADADVRIVDVRPERSFERGHIPGSECIPFARLPNEVDRLEGAEHVVTVCPHGQSSVQAARLIQSYEGLDDGARVESLAGGLDEWEDELVTGEADPEGAENEEDAVGETEAEDLGPDAPF